MKTPSVTLHVSDKGTVTVLAASLDAGVCLDIYRDTDKPGKVFYMRQGHLDKDKKVESKEQIAARAKARDEAKKKRAKAELIEAEAAAAATAEDAKQAKAKLDALKPKKAAK